MSKYFKNDEGITTTTVFIFLFLFNFLWNNCWYKRTRIIKVRHLYSTVLYLIISHYY